VSLEIKDFTRPLQITSLFAFFDWQNLILTMEAQYVYFGNRINVVVVFLKDKLFLLAIADIHSIVGDRLRDWKEESHEAEKYLFSKLRHKKD
jgi:hypothetical protein